MSNKRPEYNIIHFPSGPNMFETAEIVGRVPVRWPLNPSYMHTFGITDNYFIIVEQPLAISLVSVVKGKVMNEPLASAFKWFPDECTLFHVVSRQNGEIKFTYKAATFFFLHIISSYETEDYIVIDVCCYRDPSVLDCMYVDAMQSMHQIENYASMFQSRPLRFVLPLQAQKTQAVSRSFGSILSFVRSWTSKMNKEKLFLKWNKIGESFGRRSRKTSVSFAEKLNDNLVHLKGSAAKAYSLDDRNVFCVPESLCDLGCETPRINEKMCLGEKRTLFCLFNQQILKHFN